MISKILETVDEISLNDLPIKKKIADGGQATVYKGTYQGKPVAVKVLKECDEKCLTHEIGIIAKLDHPQVPKFYGAVKRSNNIMLVFEYLEGKTLDDCEISSMTEDQKFTIIKDFASILEYIHANGFIHRDLKPENLMMTNDEKIYLIDFGISKICPQTGFIETRLKGTIHYVAPECFDEVALTEDEEIITRVSTKVDVWAYGCIVSWLFSGSLPWCNKYANNAAVLQQVIGLKKKFPIPSIITNDVVIQIIKMATVIDPESRATMSEIKEYLEKSGK